jgi:hypothetical protein
MQYINVKVITKHAAIVISVAAGVLLAGCGGGGGTSASAGGGAASTGTVAGVVDNGGIASLDLWPGSRATAGERFLASLARWISTPAHAAPLADVIVTLNCDGGFVGEDTTGVDGSFEINGVPANETCSLSVGGIGFVTDVVTEPGTVIQVNVTINANGATTDDTVVVRGSVDDGTSDDIVERTTRKVAVCHKGRKTLSVGAPAEDAHLRHGDTPGPCPSGAPPVDDGQQASGDGSQPGDGDTQTGDGGTQTGDGNITDGREGGTSA